MLPIQLADGWAGVYTQVFLPVKQSLCSLTQLSPFQELSRDLPFKLRGSVLPEMLNRSSCQGVAARG